MTLPTESPSRAKTASRIIIYLTEELGDARLRAAQLARYVKEATDLIEKSEHRDHFFEVAAHLIQGIPETMFKLGKALDAAALAAARLDYEEIKQGLKPEKAEELEAVMEDARLRYLNRRSHEDPMKPQDVAEYLQKLADRTEVEGRVPVVPMLTLIARLEAQDKTASLNAPKAAEFFRKAAKVLGEMEGPSRRKLVGVLRRVLADTIQPTAGAMSAAILAQAGSREDVEEGFKAANPDITEEDLKKIGDEWEKNKDVVKDKQAADEIPLPRLDRVISALVAEAKDLDNLWDLYKRDPRKYEPQLENIAYAANQLQSHARVVIRSLGLSPRTAAENESLTKDANILGKMQQLQSYIGWIDSLVKQFRGGRGYMKGAYEYAKEVGNAPLLKAIEMSQDALIHLGEAHTEMARYAGYLGKMASEETAEDKESRFEEGKPADPTKEMSPEDAKEWEANTEKHKDKFKSAADEDKNAKFTKGEPADPTENMTEEQKAEWQRQNEEHKDQFKSASYDRRANQ